MSSTTTALLSRRSIITGAAGLGGLLLFGNSGLAAPAGTRLVMHRNPGCGCCTKWAEAARQAGLAVSIVDDPEIVALKAKLGVPEKLASCHTTVAGAYAIEGHVPISAVKKLLATRPKLRGIAVPGMPIGSPGMEVPGREAERFSVYAFDATGNVSRFA